MAASRIDKAGRVAIPKGMRDRLGLTAGDELELIEYNGGLLLRRPVEPGEELRGSTFNFDNSRPYQPSGRVVLRKPAPVLMLVPKKPVDSD